MPFDLDWGTYADWLIKTTGMDTSEALQRVSALYYKQYKKHFETEQEEQLREYLEERF